MRKCAINARLRQFAGAARNQTKSMYLDKLEGDDVAIWLPFISAVLRHNVAPNEPRSASVGQRRKIGFDHRPTGLSMSRFMPWHLFPHTRSAMPSRLWTSVGSSVGRRKCTRRRSSSSVSLYSESRTWVYLPLLAYIFIGAS